MYKLRMQLKSRKMRETSRNCPWINYLTLTVWVLVPAYLSFFFQNFRFLWLSNINYETKVQEYTTQLSVLEANKPKEQRFSSKFIFIPILWVHRGSSDSVFLTSFCVRKSSNSKKSKNWIDYLQAYRTLLLNIMKFSEKISKFYPISGFQYDKSFRTPPSCNRLFFCFLFILTLFSTLFVHQIKLKRRKKKKN
jgi:hypothetical protein